MKRLFVTARHNPGYLGPDHTPDTDAHVYDVAKVIDATSPDIGRCLTKAELEPFCEDDSWQVTIS